MTAVRFEPGLCSVTFRDLEPFAVIDLAVRARLSAIEWGADVHVKPGEETRARKVAEATRAAGLAVSSYGSYLEPPLAGNDEVMAVLDTALALGAPMVRVWPGRRDRPSQSYDDAERAIVVSAIETMAAAADERDLDIGLEFHPGTLTDSLSSSLRLMESLAAPNVFLYWQPRPGIVRSKALAEIKLLAVYLCHLHVFQWDAETNRYPLSDGAETWRSMIAAVGAGRFEKPRFAMLEFVRDDAPAAFLDDALALTTMLGAS